MQKHPDLAILLKAATPLVVLETHEELRAIEAFQSCLSEFWKPLYRWSVTHGLVRLDMDMPPAPGQDTSPQATLRRILQNREKSVYLLLDFAPWLEDPVNIRLIKEICQQQQAEHTLAIIGPKIPLPPSLQPIAHRYDLQLPGDAELEAMIREEAFNWSRRHDGRRVKVHKRSLEQLVRTLRGLNLKDARRLARNAIYQDGAITEEDLPQVMQAKFELLSQGGVLQFEYETARFSEVAGLRRLKHWLELRKPAFFSNKPLPGLDSPRGVLLLGVQGGGKSLAAKAVAGLYGLPLLRLDLASLYNKYHGESERNLRESLKTADIMAPCVLWVDEIEKGVATSDSDEGTSKRMLGTLLNWLSERQHPVFLVATANDISALPPELMRKGRLDEIFFVDLPDHEVRKEIFRIHLQKREQEPESFNLDELANHAEGFSGAEIEQAVVSGLYQAYAREEPLNDQHVLEALANTHPLSHVMAEKVQALREWGRSRAVPAD